jgi:pyruvate/2-oxoglutarate dehydrogenase complex dihydrolipoamide acyltransferase (E2) component
MNLTMSFDHRIIDGLAASRFLNAVQNGITQPINSKAIDAAWTRLRPS